MAQTHPASSLDSLMTTLAGWLACWLAGDEDLHGREKGEKERKGLEKLQPQVLASCIPKWICY